MSPPRGLPGVLVLAVACVAAAADDPHAELAKKPQWQRLLTGEDAKTVEKMEKRIADLEATDDYPAAVAAEEERLALRTRIQGADHHEVISAAFSVKVLVAVGKLGPAERRMWRQLNGRMGEAAQLRARARYAESLVIERAILDVRLKALGEDYPDTAQSYSNVATDLQEEGKAAEAGPLYRKALDIYRKVLGEDHPYTAVAYNNLSSNLDAQGKAAEAGPLYRRALNIYRKALGEDHPDTASIYNNVAANLNEQGKAAEAGPFFQKALDINRMALGEDHPATAGSYNNVAGNLNAQGKTAEAGPLLLQALNIRRKSLGDNHPDTATSYNNVGMNLNAQGKAAEAGPLLQKALDIHRKALGDNHPETADSYNNVAHNLAAQGKAAEAGPLYRKALDIRRKALGEDHPRTANSYENVAGNLTARGKAAEAELLFRKALDINRMALGEDHPDTANSYNSIAYNLARQGKTAEAIAALSAAIPAFESSRLAAAQGIDRANLTQFNPRLPLAAFQQIRDPAVAWIQIEFSLARGLLDQQAKSATTHLTPAEQLKQQEARQRVAAVQARLLKLVGNGNRSAGEDQELGELLTQRRQQEEIVTRLDVAESERAVEPGTRIQAALPADAAVVYWVDINDSSGRLQEHWGCVVRNAGEPRWVCLPGTGPEGKWTQEDTSLPGKLRAALAGTAPQQEVEAFARQLHAQRIAPVLKHLAGVKTLYVVPVHEMAGIPVEALTQVFTVSYVPSGTYLARLKDRPRPSGTQLLAVGDPVFDNPNAAKPKGAKRLPPGGLLLTTVLPDGAGAKAGLKAGDALLTYGGVELTSLDKLKEAVAANTAAKTVPVTVWRETEKKPFTRDIAPGKLGVVLAPDPAPVALENRRKTEEMLARIRGGEWKDLPGTRVETTRLKQLLGGDAKVLTDSAASEQGLDALRRAGELTKYRYLHFATHGEGNSVRAFDSALILAQDQLPKEFVSKPGEPYFNGQLSASEVLEFWKLDAELVTLSACETAVGKNGGGDGPLGFAQAFLTAGARSVCLSLWKVDDTATSLLMGRFYENLLGKRDGLTKPMGKAAALDEAKRWLRELSSDEALKLSAALTNGVARGDRGKNAPLNLAVPQVEAAAGPAGKPFAHPRYWAAFILIGDPN